MILQHIMFFSSSVTFQKGSFFFFFLILFDFIFIFSFFSFGNKVRCVVMTVIYICFLRTYKITIERIKYSLNQIFNKMLFIFLWVWFFLLLIRLKSVRWCGKEGMDIFFRFALNGLLKIYVWIPNTWCLCEVKLHTKIQCEFRMPLENVIMCLSVVKKFQGNWRMRCPFQKAMHHASIES